jgi:hypothetical protein
MITWTPVSGASSYNVIRGSLARIGSAGSLTVLDDAICIGRGLSSGPLSDSAAQEDPLPGEAYYFLVEYSDGRYSGYGTATGQGEVVVTGVDSCH